MIIIKLLIVSMLAMTSLLTGTKEVEKIISDPTTLITNLVETDYHKKSIIECLCLYNVDEDFFAKIRDEIFDLIKTQTPSSVNDPRHVTYWTRPFGTAVQYSLLNDSGKFDDYSCDHNKSVCGKKFHHKALYPNLAKFISLFPHAINFRINVLMPKSGLSQHEEGLFFIHDITKKPAMRVRFHLPIVTNRHSEMLLDGKVYHFDIGKIYFFHNGCIHAAANLDEETVRIHLVWDMLLTEDTFLRMFKRSIPLLLLEKNNEVYVRPLRNVAIDPNYARANKEWSYELAKKVRFCEIQ